MEEEWVATRIVRNAFARPTRPLAVGYPEAITEGDGFLCAVGIRGTAGVFAAGKGLSRYGCG